MIRRQECCGVCHVMVWPGCCRKMGGTSGKLCSGTQIKITETRAAAKTVSPWHEIPLFASDGLLHYVCEIPKETSAKMEVATVGHSCCAAAPSCGPRVLWAKEWWAPKAFHSDRCPRP
jgi:hypothetical protein